MRVPSKIKQDKASLGRMSLTRSYQHLPTLVEARAHGPLPLGLVLNGPCGLNSSACGRSFKVAGHVPHFSATFWRRCQKNIGTY